MLKHRAVIFLLVNVILIGSVYFTSVACIIVLKSREIIIRESEKLDMDKKKLEKQTGHEC